jgi:hypothetical protein
MASKATASKVMTSKEESDTTSLEDRAILKLLWGLGLVLSIDRSPIAGSIKKQQETAFVANNGSIRPDDRGGMNRFCRTFAQGFDPC